MTDTFGQDVRCKTCRSSMFATSGTFFCLSDMKRCLYFGDYHPGERFDKRCHYSLWEPKKEEKPMHRCSDTSTCGNIHCYHFGDHAHIGLCISSRGEWCANQKSLCIPWRVAGKETKMKYKQLKPISLEKLWDAQPHKTRIDFLIEWAVFTNWIFQSAYNIQWKKEWNFTYEGFMSCTKKNGHAATWLGYMERHGFIKKEFAPFDVTIRVDSEHSAAVLEKGMRLHCLPSQAEDVHDQLKAHGIEV